MPTGTRDRPEQGHLVSGHAQTQLGGGGVEAAKINKFILK